ncbi:MAG: hypothetical protein WBE46_06665, partial [Dehalococcoidia bacterium]
ILSAIRTGVGGQVASIAKRPFNGASIQIFEKEFFETIGKSGVCGLSKLFAGNDEAKRAIVYDRQKH